VLPMLTPTLSSSGALGELRMRTEPYLQTLLPLSLSLEILAVPVLSFLGAWFGLWPQLHSKRLVTVGV